MRSNVVSVCRGGDPRTNVSWLNYGGAMPQSGSGDRRSLRARVRALLRQTPPDDDTSAAEDLSASEFMTRTLADLVGEEKARASAPPQDKTARRHDPRANNQSQ